MSGDLSQLDSSLHSVVEQVRFNCHLSDALYGQSDSLCIYLLKMRELFRWERGYPLDASLPRPEIGEWISRRELHWQSIDEESPTSLTIDGKEFDPFDVAGINRALGRHRLLYGAGVGRHAKPIYFLTKLTEKREYRGVTVLIGGLEYARELSAPPALSQQGVAYIRTDALERMLWTRIEEIGGREGHPLAVALSLSEGGSSLPGQVRQLAAGEVETLIEHELGEIEAAGVIDGDWSQQLLSAAGTPLELLMRAVRDHLADALVTLPAIVNQQRTPSIHLYIANLTGIRRALYPSLLAAYRTTATKDEGKLYAAIGQLQESSASHWQRTATALLRLDPQEPIDIEQLIDKWRL